MSNRVSAMWRSIEKGKKSIYATKTNECPEYIVHSTSTNYYFSHFFVIELGLNRIHACLAVERII